ncbi:MAG: DUF1016 N-terminal domain-containing protein [Candidatus Aminicenantes bacterium]
MYNRTMTEEKLKYPEKDSLYQNIRDIIHEARQNAYRAVNFAMVQAYWNIGRLIVEEEQKGRERAEYGTHLIRDLAQKLTTEFGKGFTQQNLRNFRQFYLTFKLENGKDQIRYTLRSELSWSHYRLIMRIENPKARLYYMNEAAEQNWNVRAMERQINSFHCSLFRSRRKSKPFCLQVQTLFTYRTGID